MSALGTTYSISLRNTVPSSRRIAVLKGPGLGLEEKAISAVKNWRMRPASGPNGKPVACRVNIEVVFRLL